MKAEAAAETGSDNLPVPVGQARTIPRSTPAVETDASFAAHRRALYRVMTGAARNRGHGHPELPGQAEVVRLMREAGTGSLPANWSEKDAQLAGIAAWAAMHGLADLLTFKVLEPFKDQFGGEEAFLKAVLDHLNVFGARQD